MNGPQLAFSDELHRQKYRQENETFRDMANRVADALKDNEKHFHEFRDALLDMRFMPAGRVQTAMGSTRRSTPYNCFVSGTIADSAFEGEGSIHKRNGEALQTMRLGGGIGYDFSTLRPKGALIASLGSHSTGPVAWMDLFNAIGNVTASVGDRRGAQMAVMRVDHPDVEEFVRAKQNEHKLTRFNVSVAVTDKFMVHLAKGIPFPLTFGGRVYKEVDPAALWDAIMRSTWDHAEPGVLFIDTINRANNLWYCETIAATNPCGEQPLPPHGACLLGSFNLVRYIRKQGTRYTFDWDLFGADIPGVVRAMDNIVDRAVYPLPQQEAEAKAKRRMGLGITGLANAVEAMGFTYGSKDFITFQTDIMKRLEREAYLASVWLAQEKGAFPAYDQAMFLQPGTGSFASQLDEDVRASIAEYGLRNSHLLSVAPTGTISLCADNVSSGVEPVFSYGVERNVIMSDGPRTVFVEDYGRRVFGVQGKRCQDVTVQEHLAVLSAASRHVDSAVSKTCNVSGDVSWEDFKDIYVKAWEMGCKGCTTFRTDGQRAGMMVARDAPEPTAVCRIDTETGRRECE